VRNDCDLAPVSTSAPRNRAGTTETTGIAVAVSNRYREPIADA